MTKRNFTYGHARMPAQPCRGITQHGASYSWPGQRENPEADGMKPGRQVTDMKTVTHKKTSG